MDESLVVDPVANRLILFGGAYADNPAAPGADAHAYNDLWSYEPAANTWSELQPSGTAPTARTAPLAVYDPQLQAIFIYGGVVDDSSYSGAVAGDLWRYDLSANRWSKLDPAGQTPAPRIQAGLTYDPASHTLLLFGGSIFDAQSDRKLFNDLWQYDPALNEWTELHPSGASPEPRRSAWLAIDPTTGRLLLFGGETKVSKPSGSIPMDTVAINELWTYDRQKNTWTKLRPNGAELPRTGCFVYDEAIRQFVLIAGFDSADGQVRLEVYTWDPASNIARKLSPKGTHPLWNGFESFAYSPQQKQMMVFGGNNYLLVGDGTAKPPTVYYQDFWAWSPE
jgi:N-acetylneuraminic acid mutarotase